MAEYAERGHPLTIAVIDSVGESVAVSGLGGNDDSDMAAWFAALPKWIVTQWPGAAAVVIDHLPKNIPDSGAIYPIGSQQKRAKVHAQYWVKLVQLFSKLQDDYSVVICANERSGTYLLRQPVSQAERGSVWHSTGLGAGSGSGGDRLTVTVVVTVTELGVTVTVTLGVTVLVP